jgi:hypothetical protein
MTSRDFCYWLQGMFELGTPKSFDEVRTDQIRKHLALVFKHEIDPSAGPPEHQAVLNEIHGPKPEPSKAGPPPYYPNHDIRFRC